MWTPSAHRRIAFAALVAAPLALAACEREAAAPPAPAPPAVTPPAPAVVPPAPVATLNRVELLQAMETAAAAAAAGAPAEPDGLAGRRFLVRQAFGCFGPGPQPAAGAEADGLARWRSKERPAGLEITLTPAAWTEAPLVGAADAWEAVEGIWLTRPWLRSEACPGGVTGGGDATASPQTMGLAAVFEKGGSRLGRRNGRAYSFTVRGKDGAPPPPPAGGYRLVLEGRLASFADGRAIHCQAASPDQRPVCLAASRLDRVAFEDADGTVLSEWAPAAAAG